MINILKPGKHTPGNINGFDILRGVDLKDPNIKLEYEKSNSFLEVKNFVSRYINHNTKNCWVSSLNKKPSIFHILFVENLVFSSP